MAQSDMPDEPAQVPTEVEAASRGVRVRQLLKRVGLGVGAGLLVWQTWRAVSQISSSGVALPSVGALLAALLLAMLSHLAQMAGWREVMTGLGTRLSWRLIIEGYMLSMLPRYIPGTVWGYLSRGQWLYERAGVSFRSSSVSSVMEMGLIIGSGLVFAASVYFQSVLAGGAVLLVSCFGYALARYVAQRLKWTRQMPLISLGRFTSAFILYGLIWPLYGLIIAGLLAGATSLWRALIEYGYAFFVAWTSGLLAFFIPSGLGVREFALQSMLQADGLTGPLIIAVPLLVRLATIISEILWLCVGLALKRVK